MSTYNFNMGDKVIRGKLIGVVDELSAINDASPYTHHITWEDGRKDWYADKLFRTGEIQHYTPMTTNSDEQSVKNAHYPDQPDIEQRMDEVLYTVARKAVDESYVLDDGGSQLGKITADRIVAEGKQALLALITEARLNEVQRAYESHNNATPEAHAEYFRDRIDELTKQKEEM